MLKILFFLFASGLYSQQIWEHLNSPPGGEFVSIELNSESMVAGTLNGFIYYSSNTGKTWNCSDNRFSRNIEEFVYTKSGSIIAACYEDGVWKSIDGGKSWISILKNVNAWSVTRDTAGYVYVGTREPASIYRTNNDGQTWSTVAYNFSESLTWTIYNSKSNNYLFAGTYHYIYRSTTGGRSWDRLINAPYITDDYVNFDNDEDGNLYALTFFGDVFKSTDYGDSWTTLYDNHFTPEYYFTMIKYLGNGYLLTGSSEGLFRISADGSSWEKLNSNLKVKCISDIKIDQFGNLIIATDGGGIFKSQDQGSSWERINEGINEAYIADLYIDGEGYLYAAAKFSGLFMSIDSGTSWINIDSGINDLVFTCIKGADYGILLSCTAESLYCSKNNGLTWQPLIEICGITPQSLSLNSNKVFLADPCRGGGGFFASSDYGSSWEQPLTNAQIISMISSGDTIYAGGSSRIYSSSDAGNNWLATSVGLEKSGYIYALEKSKAGMLFAGTRYNGIFRSSDAGLSWFRPNDLMIDKFIFCIKEIENNFLLAGTNKGLWLSRDLGINWEPFNSGLTASEVHVIMQDNSNYIYLGTNRGLYRTNKNLTFLAKQKQAIFSDLLQIHPNPFNLTTTIDYHLRKEGNVKIVIYDMLGRIVSNLLESHKTAGKYSIVFQADNLCSGSYICRINTSEQILSKKLLLLK